MTTGIRVGLIAFAIYLYLLLVGIPGRIGSSAAPVLAVVMGVLFYLMLRRQATPTPTLLVQGLAAGFTTGLLITGVGALFTEMIGNGIRIQPIFDKIVPQNMASLVGVGPGDVGRGEVSVVRYLLLFGWTLLGGLLGTGLVLLLRRRRIQYSSGATLPGGHWLILLLPLLLYGFIYYLGLSGVKMFGTSQGTVRLLIALIATGSGLFALRAAREGRERTVVTIALLVMIATLPFILDRFQNSVLSIVFIFVMMGLGLNIVVGFAGLLDLGYVAFFAIGAYVYAFLSAPFSSVWISQLLINLGISPESPLLGYWMAIPVTMGVATLGGVLLGIPVLRLRGDYLAIVTLGFGEIIRLFMLNLGDLTNGPRGLLEISPPIIGAYSLGEPRWILVLALLGSALIAFVAIRLNDSRLGRAWVAMREDEDVAQATGIHLVRTKLLAFGIGAAFAGLAGQLYAARQVNIFPENFSLFVSIDALSLIIVGGMGSIPGVVLGALALKGLPEVLRGVDEYRIVTFAALLVLMMIVRPEGILPSRRRQQELAGEIQAEGPPIDIDLSRGPEGMSASDQRGGGDAR